MKTGLLALPFWTGDKDAAMRIARLVADLEPHFNDHFDFLFLARFDTTIDDDTVKYVSRKFNVQTYVNKNRRGVGWPYGCNELFFGLMDYVYMMREANKIPAYKFILNFEGDSCPLRRDWLLRLNEQWDRHQVKVLGPIIPPGPPATGGLHCNGNAMYSADMDFLHWLARKESGCSPAGGFDFLLAPKFRKWGWADCRIMRSWWHCGALTKEVVENLQREDVVFLHGDKTSATSDVIRAQNGL